MTPRAVALGLAAAAVLVLLLRALDAPAVSSFLLSQIIIAIGLIFDVISFQLKERRHLVFSQILAAIFIALHFFLLGQQTAGVLFALAGIRLYVSLHSRTDFVRNVFLSSSVLASWWTYAGSLSLIGCAANLIMTTGAFAHTNKGMRLCLIGGSSVWLVHNVLVWTPVGVFMELLFLSSGLIGYFRQFVRSHRPTCTVRATIRIG